MPLLGGMMKSFAGNIVIASPTGPLCDVNDLPVVVTGSIVLSHAATRSVPVPLVVAGSIIVLPLAPRHRFPVMVTGSPSVFCGDLPVCPVGSLATCGHPLLTISDVEVDL